MRVGVLAVQGGFSAHACTLRDIGHVPALVREPRDLAGVEGLCFPGGESTTQLKMIERVGLEAPLTALVESGVPVLATCAGLILAARQVTHPVQRSFGWLDVAVARNAWGRQVHSFEAETDGPLPGDTTPLPLLFIRAPRILDIGGDVDVLATFEGEPIAVREGNLYAAAFHPELTADARLHARVFGEV